MPIHILRSHFGRIGESLHAKALGDARESFSEGFGTSTAENEPVLSYPSCKSIGHEETFQDTADPGEILSILAGLCAEAGFRLREKALTTSLVTLKLRYSDFKTVSTREPVHCIFADDDIFAKAKELLNRLYTRRMPLRLVGVRLSRLAKNLHEIPLFEWEKRLKKKALYIAVDKVRSRLGKDSLLPLLAKKDAPGKNRPALSRLEKAKNLAP
jgi:DNA polymerase-4